MGFLFIYLFFIPLWCWNTISNVEKDIWGLTRKGNGSWVWYFWWQSVIKKSEEFQACCPSSPPVHCCNTGSWMSISIATIDGGRNWSLTPCVNIGFLSEGISPWCSLPWWQVSCCITIELHLICRILEIWFRHKCVWFWWFIGRKRGWLFLRLWRHWSL